MDLIGGIILRKWKNYLFCLLLTVVLGMLLSVFFLVDQGDIQVMFRVVSGTDSQQIALWDAGDGSHILFLPSYADLERVSLSSDLKNGIAIDGVAMTEGSSCIGFSLDKPYELTINGREAGTIQFCRSANVATMFIDTASGDVVRIHRDKDYRETATVKVYSDAGIMERSDAAASLKGRGNSTWDNAKKPYLLTLSTEQEMLGMASAGKWVLLANATDETNLHNKLVFDFARQLGCGWVPDCAYADVYLNGIYYGLYLITEKIEATPNRLVLDTNTGEFLCKIDLKSRVGTLNNPFMTPAGRTVEITVPDSPSSAEKKRVIELVEQMEREILSGANLSDSEILDLDSWVRRYLIDEISGNADSDLASSYFYYSGGRFIAGPLWDYDLTFGNSVRNDEPQSYVAANVNKGGESASIYYEALLSNASFRTRMAEIYETEFCPLLEQWPEKIDYLSNTLKKASELNSIRWRTVFDIRSSTVDIPVGTEGMLDYISARLEFLNSIWLDGTTYCTLQFEHPAGGAYDIVSVRLGECFSMDQVGSLDTVWVDARTGEVFDFNRPITQDAVLIRQSDYGRSGRELATREYITFASIAGVLFLLVTFAAVDLIHNRKERK